MKPLIFLSLFVLGFVSVKAQNNPFVGNWEVQAETDGDWESVGLEYDFSETGVLKIIAFSNPAFCAWPLRS